MSIKALFINCTLKYPPEKSHTDALIHKVAGLMEACGAETEVVRALSYNIKFGISSDEGDGDEWPQLLEKIIASDILVIGAPIWVGGRSCVAQLIIERLDGTYGERDVNGQYPLYNKVGGVVVTGNEDGAHDVAANTLFNLSHLGCVIPPNSDCYWVGDAGPGPSYMDAGGDAHLYTNRTARYMAHNCVAMARFLREHPLKTNLNELDREAENVSIAHEKAVK